MLDVIVTNLASYFNEPVIIPPILPDQPGHGAPSDHCCVFATPRPNQPQSEGRTKVRKKIRPLPDSLLLNFEYKLSTQDFNMENSLSVQEMVDKFQSVTSLLHETFPEKEEYAKKIPG